MPQGAAGPSLPPKPSAKRSPRRAMRKSAVTWRQVCGGEAEIAELPVQVREQMGRVRDRLFRVERIGETALPRRPGHELSHPLRADRADRGDAKAALPPDQPRKERNRQGMGPGRAVDQPAQGLLHGLAARLGTSRMG